MYHLFGKKTLFLAGKNGFTQLMASGRHDVRAHATHPVSDLDPPPNDAGLGGVPGVHQGGVQGRAAEGAARRDGAHAAGQEGAGGRPGPVPRGGGSGGGCLAVLDRSRLPFEARENAAAGERGFGLLAPGVIWQVTPVTDKFFFPTPPPEWTTFARSAWVDSRQLIFLNSN